MKHVTPTGWPLPAALTNPEPPAETVARLAAEVPDPGAWRWLLAAAVARGLRLGGHPESAARWLEFARVSAENATGCRGRGPGAVVDALLVAMYRRERLNDCEYQAKVFLTRLEHALVGRVAPPGLKVAIAQVRGRIDSPALSD